MTITILHDKQCTRLSGLAKWKRRLTGNYSGCSGRVQVGGGIGGQGADDYFMTILFSLLRALLGGGLCLLASCAVQTPQTRMAKNPELFEALTPRQQELVRQGKIDRDLPKTGVWIAWGRPDRVAVWDRSGSRIERWTYLGLRPVNTYTLGVGTGPVGLGWYTDPTFYGGPVVEWVPYPVSRVDFHHDLVTEWEVRLSQP